MSPTADTKISDLTALTGANLATTDEFVVVDKSDTSMAASGTDKRMTATELGTGLATLQVVQPYDGDLTSLAAAFTPASAAGPTSLDFAEDTDNGTNKITVAGVASVTSDKTLTLPDATDTLVGKATTDTLTNKTLTTPTVGSFTNANHTHQNAAGAGTLDHGLALTGLTDDDHTQYPLLAGRSGGQTVKGGTGSGDDLTLQSTNHATRGKIVAVDPITCTTGQSILTAAGDTITPTSSVHRLQNNSGGSLTMTSAPTIPDGEDGQLLLLFNIGTQNVVLQDQGTLASSNLRLAAATVTMTPRDSILLMFTSGLGDWLQVTALFSAV